MKNLKNLFDKRNSGLDFMAEMFFTYYAKNSIINLNNHENRNTETNVLIFENDKIFKLFGYYEKDKHLTESTFTSIPIIEEVDENGDIVTYEDEEKTNYCIVNHDILVLSIGTVLSESENVDEETENIMYEAPVGYIFKDFLKLKNKFSVGKDGINRTKRIGMFIINYSTDYYGECDSYTDFVGFIKTFRIEDIIETHSLENRKEEEEELMRSYEML